MTMTLVNNEHYNLESGIGSVKNVIIVNVLGHYITFKRPKQLNDAPNIHA